ncbi:hypothetical protein Pan241w_43230 [Gimesia alba]|uniref:Leucine Rich repeats (2 copies) n=1 Tax=Gimesia alba TaxID=2527973 RepID=A0A517RK03_9PLAN|nr:hypothetical protein [Gimesia alba]QDT44215.1 hypothetical protein Pan241w_43230 [Gimesia alba]
MDVRPKSGLKISTRLVLLILLIGFLSFHAYHRYCFEKRKALAQRLKDAGATVRYTWFGVSSMPAFLRPHLHFIDLPVKPRVYDIDANNSQVSDETLRGLERMTYLDFLKLENCNVSDIALTRLKDLENLREINLKGTQITDQGLRHLENKPYLLLINLEQTAVTPVAVNRLRSKINQLKENLTSSTQRDKKLVITFSNEVSRPEQLLTLSVKSD